MVRAPLATLRLRMRARLPSVAVLAALAVAAAGCTSSGSGSGGSSGDFKGEQQLVANTVEDLQTAASQGDQGEICANLLAHDLVDRLDARGGCRKLVDAALKDTDTSDLSVQSVAVNGTTADARVKAENGSNDRISTLRLVKQDGRWKIASLG
jgi:type IV pilus biogenesis protein CpaD/CtpE